MTDDGQPIDPPADLLGAARRVTSPWLVRTIEAAARRGGCRPAELDDAELRRVVDRTERAIVADLVDLLGQDVDDQRTNPLSVYRAHLGPATEFLRSAGATPPSGDRFADERFPGDPYHLGPATWSDIGDEMHLPGLVWGAWKAKTVLDRRRDEGKR